MGVVCVAVGVCRVGVLRLLLVEWSQLFELELLQLDQLLVLLLFGYWQAQLGMDAGGRRGASVAAGMAMRVVVGRRGGGRGRR